MKPRRPLEERFWEKVQGGDVTTCWVWTGARHPKGYGAFSIGGRAGRPHPAHRVAYELLVADIPPGLELDHLCRNAACVNPWHCEPVTTEVNLARTAGIPQPGKRGNTNACGARRSRTLTNATL